MNSNADRWLKLYNEGMSHEEIALDHGDGYSQATVGRTLRAHPDYIPRPAHTPDGAKNHRVSKDNQKPSEKPSIKTVGKAGATATHRRRSRIW